MKLTIGDLRTIHRAGDRRLDTLKSLVVTGVSTDSRTTAPGDLFVALRGEQFDGHAFLAAAVRRGAVAAVVDTRFDAGAVSDLPLIIVQETGVALGELARLYRDKFSIPVLAVGGSNGKTTTKEMIASVLRERHTVLSTEGNLNNQVGVPRTIFRLARTHEIAVLELGTNHPGEIAHLCRVVRPTHGLVTNIGREHLEFFANVEGVAEEEGALFAAVRGTPRGTAIVNADDVRVRAHAAGIRRTVSYGFTARRATVRGRNVVLDPAGCPRFEFTTTAMKGWMDVQLAVPGAHNASNALAAAAVGFAFKVPARHIRKALQAFRAASKRMETVMISGVVVLNDSYNANPDSMLAALRTLAATRGPGKRIAVLADMKELGTRAEEEHAAIGREAAALGLDFILTYGPLALQIHRAAGIRGAIHYEQKNILAEYLAELVAPGDTVLIKGSRGMKMEDVVVFLEQRLRLPATS